MRACDNDHLLRLTIDPARNAKILSDRLAKVTMSSVVDISENVIATTPGIVRQDPRPSGEREGFALWEPRI